MRKWREKISKQYKRTSDNFLRMACICTFIDVINFLCIIGTIEFELSIRTLLFQVTVFGVCTGIIFTCLAVSKANDYKAVRILEEDNRNETL